MEPGEALYPWPLVLVGVVLMLPFLASVVMLVKSLRRRAAWRHAEATVTSVKRERMRRDRPDTSHVVTYRFVDETGWTRTGVDHPMFRKPSRGSTIAVMYHPDDPDLSERSGLGWLFIMMIGFAALFAVGALVLRHGVAQLGA